MGVSGLRLKRGWLRRWQPLHVKEADREAGRGQKDPLKADTVLACTSRLGSSTHSHIYLDRSSPEKRNDLSGQSCFYGSSWASRPPPPERRDSSRLSTSSQQILPVDTSARSIPHRAPTKNSQSRKRHVRNPSHPSRPSFSKVKTKLHQANKWGEAWRVRLKQTGKLASRQSQITQQRGEHSLTTNEYTQKTLLYIILLYS